MQYFIQVFQQTPIWVYSIFLVCVFLGIKSAKTRTIAYKKLFLLPFPFLVWSFGYLVEKYGISSLRLSVWIFAITFGTTVGWLAHRPIKVVIDTKKKRITIPGTWSVLLLSILLFFSKYSFGYLHAIAEGAKDRFLIFGSDLFISGTISGIFLGKIFCFLEKIRKKI